jgi:hypothetical protein
MDTGVLEVSEARGRSFMEFFDALCLLDIVDAVHFAQPFDQILVLFMPPSFFFSLAIPYGN